MRAMFDTGISPAEWNWRQRTGFMYFPWGTWCGACGSRVYLKDCPNDECYNFAPGIDFWLTGKEWMRDDGNELDN